MPTHTKIVTHISIAITLSIGLFAFTFHRTSITESVTSAHRPMEITLIPIHDQNAHQNPNSGNAAVEERK